jgi:hypothetical protein
MALPNTTTITAIKSIAVQVPGVNLTKLFLVLIHSLFFKAGSIQFSVTNIVNSYKMVQLT